ncbi:hypothetical protein [Paludisphaera soli]|uniref:hypothetical protein n=1 Tax=Paludisphaera soli TaxID=2712865 RepID=UPI0013EAB9BA|nr:hypothetical protein [Paludisphaera soli]
MKGTRLRAPSTDGGLLATPPLDQAAALVDANQAWASTWRHDFQGRPADWLRQQVRRQAAAESRAYLAEIGVEPPAARIEEPAGRGAWIVTGHQPELYHPGVWVKNFAAAGVAAGEGASALNLIIDDDIPKSSSIRVPALKNGRLSVRRIEFDRWEGEAPYEDLPVRDEEAFASFPTRVRDELDGLIADPLIDRFWTEVARYRESGLPLGLRLAAARRRVEASWGISNFEVPFSRICQTEGFAWFACHLLAHLARFQTIHNRALLEYRELYKIRSKNHPVSALRREGDWMEAPFWTWRAGRPRRRPLMVRQDAHSMQLRIADEAEPFLELPLSPEREACCAVERLLELPATGVRLRTRALTTTMFSRYLLSDLFIHGIGGAKYDELGDVVARRFFQDAEPPGFLTLSLTAWLGLPESPATPRSLAEIDRQIRDLEYNPDLNLSGPQSDAHRDLIAEKRSVVAAEPPTHEGRVARFRKIRAINEALRPLVADRIEVLKGERLAMVEELEENRLARSREYAVVLHSQGRLRPLLTDLARPATVPAIEAVES